MPAIVLALFPVLFIPTLTDAYVLPRAALAIAAGCLLFGWGLVASGPSLGSLGRPALAVAAAAIAATLLSVAPTLSLIGSYTRYESLLMRLSYLGLFAGSAWLARSPASRNWALTGFIAGSVVASVEAIFEAATGFPTRPDGNLGQANLLGAVLAMAIPIVCSRAFRNRLWLIALLPLLGGAVASSSRSGWLGAIAGTALLFPLLAGSMRPRLILVGVSAGTVVLVVGAILLSPLASLNGDTGTARLHVWRDSVALIAARPLTGYGEDTLGLVFGPHLTGNWEPGATFDRVHQGELDLLAAQGLLGFGACTWFFGAWLLSAWRRAWSALAAPEPVVVSVIAAWAGYFVVVQLNFDWVPATAPLWMLAGVAWAGLREPASAPLRPRQVALAALPPLAAFAIAFGILPILADGSADRGDPAAAVRLDPLQAQYHRLLGERQLASRNPSALRQGLHELNRAADFGEYDAVAFIELGDGELRAGNDDRAKAAYRRALELDPYNTSARERLRQGAGK